MSQVALYGNEVQYHWLRGHGVHDIELLFRASGRAMYTLYSPVREMALKEDRKEVDKKRLCHDVYLASRLSSCLLLVGLSVSN